MITSLKLQNFILADDIFINFGKGLQIVSGETGAGKSVLIGAIAAILGKNNSYSKVYDNKPSYLEACFDFDKNNLNLIKCLKKHDFEIEDEEIFIAKEISVSNRSKSFINGRRVSKEILSDFSQALLDFNSQKDQALLFNTEFQLNLLDDYANLAKQKLEFTQKFELCRKIEKQLKSLKTEEEQKAEKLALYTFQTKEITNVQLKENEDIELEKELYILNNQEDILNTTSRFNYSCYDHDASIYDLLNSYLNDFEKLADVSDLAKETAEHITEAIAHLEDAVAKANRLNSDIELDDSRLEECNYRLDEINGITSKYGKSITDLIEYNKKLKAFIENHSSQKDEINQLKKQYVNELTILNDLAKNISDKRKKTALKLEKEVEINLKKLAIPSAKLNIKFDKISNSTENKISISDFNKNGYDKIEFLFAANVGKNVDVLKNVISGGELSRLLLAIKKILASKLPPITVVFDEIDAGIGGKTATEVAEFIKIIAKNHQVLCITHQPTIAAKASNHFAISKFTKNNKTFIDVNALNKAQQRNEIARMLSGEVSQTAIEHAEELLKK